MLVGKKEYVSIREFSAFPIDEVKFNYKFMNRNIVFNFTIPSNSHTIIKIFDISGRTVSTLFKGTTQGKHSITWNASKVPAGIYFFNVKIKNKSLSSKISLF